MKSEGKRKPYEVECCGIYDVVWAVSAGKARYQAALSAYDVGFLKRANPSQVRCRRLIEPGDTKCAVDRGRLL